MPPISWNNLPRVARSPPPVDLEVDGRTARVVLVALAAGVAPALRALAVDPASALRGE